MRLHSFKAEEIREDLILYSRGKDEGVRFVLVNWNL